jgi:hypothetical protein
MNMKAPKNASTRIRIVGYIILIIGMITVLHDAIGRTIYSKPMEMGIVVGYTSIIMLAIVALTIAECFKMIEERLNQIERSVA